MLKKHSLMSAVFIVMSILLSLGTSTGLATSGKALNSIHSVQINPSFVEYQIPTPNSNSNGITIGPDGNIWFTEFEANKIGRMTPDGLFTEFNVPTANSHPVYITTGPDGNLWFTE